MPLSAGALRRQSWGISPETQFQVAMGHLMWVLETEPKPLQEQCTVLATEPSLQTRLLALLFLPQSPGFLSGSYLQPHQNHVAWSISTACMGKKWTLATTCMHHPLLQGATVICGLAAM